MTVALGRIMFLARRRSHLAFGRVFLGLLVVAATLSVSAAVRAEDKSSTASPPSGVNNSPLVCLTGGLGGTDVGIATMLSGTIAVWHLQLTGRLMSTQEVSFDFLGKPGTGVSEYGVMLGYGRVVGGMRTYAVAGVGSVTASHGRDKPGADDSSWVRYEKVTTKATSIPIELGIDGGRSVVAVGLALVASLNTAESYVGFLLTLSLGKVR